MPTFGTRSKKNLSEAHPKLQKLFNEVIKYYDCSVIEGHRTKEEQDKAFFSGKSKVKWPNSKHNSIPSMAVDVVPWPVDWNDIDRFKEFCWFVKGVAAGLGIRIESGGLDWESFKDYPHFQLEDK